MSARITLHCNTTWQYGACAAQIMTDALTVPEARAAARTRGWRHVPDGGPDGRDYCAACSGRGPQPADAVVVFVRTAGRTPQRAR
ncbi:hypothetical protein [Streptomyces similanensis]|uniref:Uncharacterized protein n=1 Tax=Streptomyces similanensis TaxID=1274988 RepID=A0ABP9L3S0_9ACTN